jgi:hypothetical protein
VGATLKNLQEENDTARNFKKDEEQDDEFCRQEV